MTPQEFIKLMKQHQKEIDNYVNNIAPREIGAVAVQLFQENFDKEGFVDSTNKITPWKEVERRNPESTWYGFDVTDQHHKSTKRTKDKILHDTGELEASIDWEAGNAQVTIYSDKPYAKVHNEGGIAYIFGKKAFQMPKRQFIGNSKALDKKIIKLLSDALDRILK